MSVTIDLPEEIEQQLETEWGDLPRRALEAVALEGYRSGALTLAQLRRLLGFETRMEADAFLKQHGVYLDYTEADLERDRETHRKLRELASQ
jgi:predicted HTH domain antitoxin